MTPRRNHIPDSIWQAALSEAIDASGLWAHQILSGARGKKCARARHHMAWLLYEAGYGDCEIGRRFGHSDHTSSRHGRMAHEKRAAVVEELKPAIVHRVFGAAKSRLPKRVVVVPIRRIAKQRPALAAIYRRAMPTKELVLSLAGEAAAAWETTPASVLGCSRHQAGLQARKSVWATLLCAGYSCNGVAKVWGCSRKSLQRVRRELERSDAQRVAAE